MCKYSLEGYKFRDAKEGETLVANVHYSAHRGTLSPEGNTKMLACVKHETKLTIENLQLVSRLGLRRRYGGKLPHNADFGMVRHATDDVCLRDRIGTRQVVTLLDGEILTSGYDYIEFEDGVVSMIYHLSPGTTCYVGVKSTLEEKLQLDEKSLRAIAADDPKDKPDDEKPVDEPTEEDKKETARLYAELAPARAPRYRVRGRFARRTLVDTF